MGSNKEKDNIAIAILEKLPFLKGKKNISHCDGSNNIFAGCITYKLTSDTIMIIFHKFEKIFVFLFLMSFNLISMIIQNLYNIIYIFDLDLVWRMQLMFIKG